MTPLEKRIEKLERGLRRWRTASSLVLLLLGALLLLSMRTREEKEEITPVVRTRRIEIYNAKGRSVLIADAEDQGNGFLCLMNHEGREVLKIGVGSCPKVEDSGFLAVHGQAARIVMDGEPSGGQASGIVEMGTTPLFFPGRSSPETGGLLTIRNTEDKAEVKVGYEEMAARDKAGKLYFRVYVDGRGRCLMITPKHAR